MPAFSYFCLAIFLVFAAIGSDVASADPVEEALDLAKNTQPGEDSVTDPNETVLSQTPDSESSGPVQAVYPGVENRKLETGGNGKPASSLYYPVFQNETVDAGVKKFVEGVAETYAAEVDESATPEEDKPESWDRWEQMGTFTLNRPNPEIVSITFDIFRYTGGAHGQIFIAVFNFNLANGQLLGLNELFGDPQKALQIMSALSREKLLKSLGEDADEEMLADGTEPIESNFSNLSLSPEGVTVEFQPYQVGPWVIGQQHVDITLAELAEAHPSKQVWPTQKSNS